VERRTLRHRPIMRLAQLLSLVAVAGVVSASTQLIQPSTFTVPGPFPTSVFSKYFNSPTATSAQPQPVVSDPVLVAYLLFPLSLLQIFHDSAM
jgi:sphingomyelin phosphodiesterase